jgi:hypothetical protein
MLRIATDPTRFQRATNLDRQPFRLQSLSVPARRGIANAGIAAAVRSESIPVVDWHGLVCSPCGPAGMSTPRVCAPFGAAEMPGSVVDA